MKRRILFVVLLALTIVLVFAVTANAKKPEAPHFSTHAVGTFDYHVPAYESVDGIWYYDGTNWLVVDGHIDLRVDIESVARPLDLTMTAQTGI